MLPWFSWFADALVEPLALAVAWVVLIAQLVIGACLITNRCVRPALWAGIVLNLAFTMAGRVNPSAFYLVMEITPLFALARPVNESIAVRRAARWRGRVLAEVGERRVGGHFRAAPTPDCE